jgi:hypothetical protein
MYSAVIHDSPEDSMVLVHTFRHRFLVIPCQTTLAGVFAGARWPRGGLLPFVDLRRTPRVRDFEEDGVELFEGRFMNLFVVPEDHLHQQ